MASFFAFAYLIGALIVGPVVIVAVLDRRDRRRATAWTTPTLHRTRKEVTR